jgi:hypothetical protein
MTANVGHTFRHLVAVGVFAILAIVWSFPLVLHLATHLPGRGPGDNIDFLWNFWWMRKALASGQPFFHTSYLFVPLGADLTLHTHTALPALLGATVLGRLPVVAAQNVAILIGLFLNGFCTYLLTWKVTRDQGAGLIGGIVFAGSPYIAAHLNGHFNFTMAWTIPLFALAASEAIQGSTGWAAVAGMLLGITAFIDYYYLVYESALGLCLAGLAARDWSIVSIGERSPKRVLAHVVALMIGVDVAVLAAIAGTGGFNIDLGAIRVSAHELFNPLQAFWVLVALFLWLRFRPTIVGRRRATWEPGRIARVALLAAIVFLVVAAPLVWAGAELVYRGEYVTYPYSWPNAPKGIDLASFILGNPMNGIWGAGVRHVYQRVGIDVIESSGWLGMAPMVLALWATHGPAGSAANTVVESRLSTAAYPGSETVRQWSAIGLVFCVWALGPHLMVFGINTGMILPEVLLRFVPIVANTRIPGRAMVVSYLALSVLGAVAVSNRRDSRWPRLILVLVTMVLVVDYFPAPFPLTPLDRPAIYDVLRDRAEVGAVCELPLGIRDGSGVRGAFDDRVLFYQTIHQRPLVGGFIARLPAAVITTYQGDPLLAGLLRLSERPTAATAAWQLPDRLLAAERLRLNGIAFVVLNRDLASAALIDYVQRVLPLTLIAESGGRSLYLVSR